MIKTIFFFLFIAFSNASTITSLKSSNVSLQASAMLLYPPNAFLQLYCDVPNLNQYTAMIFMVSGTIIYDSTTGYQAPSVNVLAPNRIEYSNITLGVVDALCMANKTLSNLLTIPYLKSLVYSHQPTNPYLGYTFEPHCNLEITPIPKVYSILFQRDNNFTGNWTVDGSVMIWSTPTKAPDLLVTSGSSQYPTFTTRQLASDTSANGVYTCSLYYSSSRFTYTYSTAGVNVNFLKVGTSTTLAPTPTPPKYSANLTISPSELRFGRQNTLICYVVMPTTALATHYNVSFFYNSQKVGNYLKQNNSSITWFAPSVVSSFTFIRGSTWTYPFYTAALFPINNQAAGYYQCSVSYSDESSSTIIEHKSSIWFLQNSAVSLLSCNVMAILLLISISVVHHYLII